MFDYTDVKTLDFTDFSGGINTADTAELLPINTLTEATNVYFTEHGLQQRPPFKFIQNNFVAYTVDSNSTYLENVLDYKVFPVDVPGWSSSGNSSTGGLHCIYGKVGNNYVLCVCKLVGNAYVWSKVLEDTNAFNFTFFRFGSVNELIVFFKDGNNDNQKPKRIVLQSGGSTSTSVLGLTAPSSSNLTVSTEYQTTGGSISVSANDKIYYRFIFEYYPTSDSSANGFSALAYQVEVNCSTASNAARVKLTLTKPSNGATTASFVHIYRAPKNNPAGVYRWIGVAEYTQSYVFYDDKAWNSEGDPAPILSSVSDLGSFRAEQLFFAANRFFVNSTNEPNKLQWSSVGSADVWPTLNFSRLEGSIKAVVEFNRRVFVFTTLAVYEWDAENETAMLISRVGCEDEKSVAVSTYGIYWKNGNDVYFADFIEQYKSDGDFPALISNPIRNVVGALNGRAGIYKDNYLLPVFNQTGNNILVFNVLTKCWTVWPIPLQFLAQGKTQLYAAARLAFKVGSATVYYVCVYEFDYVAYLSSQADPYKGRDWRDHINPQVGDIAQTVISPSVKVGREGIVIGDGFVWFQPLGVACFLKGEGANIQVRCVVKENGRAVNISDQFDTSSIQLTENMIYNSATYQGGGSGNGVYAGSMQQSKLIKRRFQYPIRTKNIFIGLELSTARDITLNGWRVYYRSGQITI